MNSQDFIPYWRYTHPTFVAVRSSVSEDRTILGGAFAGAPISVSIARAGAGFGMAFCGGKRPNGNPTDVAKAHIASAGEALGRSLAEAAKWVEGAINRIVQMIIDMAQNMLNKAFAPIQEQLYDFFLGIKNAFIAAYAGVLFPADVEDPPLGEALAKALFTGVFITLMVLSTVLIVITTIFLYSTGGITQVLGKFISAIAENLVLLIISTIILSVSSGIITFFLAGDMLGAKDYLKGLIGQELNNADTLLDDIFNFMSSAYTSYVQIIVKYKDVPFHKAISGFVIAAIALIIDLFIVASYGNLAIILSSFAVIISGAGLYLVITDDILQDLNKPLYMIYTTFSTLALIKSILVLIAMCGDD